MADSSLVYTVGLCYFYSMLFTLLLFPLLFFILTDGINWAGTDGSVSISKKTIYFHAFCGLMIAVIYCAIDWFFVSPVRFAEYSFCEEFVRILIFQILMPVGICAVLYFLPVKESFDYKFKNFALLMFGFFAVFLPYHIYTRANPVPAFLSFAKPVIILGFIIALHYVLKGIAGGFAKKKAGIIVLFFFILFVLLVLPPVIETLWFLSFSPWIVYPVIAVYFAVCLLLIPFLSVKLNG